MRNMQTVQLPYFLIQSIEGLLANLADKGNAVAAELRSAIMDHMPLAEDADKLKVGTLVLSLHGEINEIDGHEPHTGPLAEGYIDAVFPNQHDCYSVVFPATGHGIWLSETEITDHMAYHVTGILQDREVIGIDDSQNILIWSAKTKRAEVLADGLAGLMLKDLTSRELLRLHDLYVQQEQYKEEGEVVVKLADGRTLRSGVICSDLTTGEYVRLCDQNGNEQGFWAHEEWEADGIQVMGAIMNAAAGLAVPNIADLDLT